MGANIAVANTEDDSISIFNEYGSHLLKQIILDVPGHGPKIGPRRIIHTYGQNIFSANAYDATVSMIDIGIGKEIAFYSVGAYPYDLCQNGDYILVCCGDSDNIWRLDRRNGEIICFIKCGRFPCAACNCDGRIAVANMLDCTISLMDDEKLMPVYGFDIQGTPMGIAFNGGSLYAAYSHPDYSKAYICRYTMYGEKLTVPRDVGVMPFKVLPIMLKGDVFIAVSSDAGIFIEDRKSLDTIKQIKMSGMPDDIAYGLDHLFVTNPISNELLIYDSRFELVKKTICGKEPRGVCIVPDA